MISFTQNFSRFRCNRVSSHSTRDIYDALPNALLFLCENAIGSRLNQSDSLFAFYSQVYEILLNTRAIKKAVTIATKRDIGVVCARVC